METLKVLCSVVTEDVLHVFTPLQLLIFLYNTFSYTVEMSFFYYIIFYNLDI